MRRRRVKVLIKKGDITQEDADAIVNPANTSGFMGAGVAGAIKRAGGREIEEEAIAGTPGVIGEAWITTAGKLPARYVIHAATMGLDFKTEEWKIRLAVRNAMARARELGIRSIAFPAMGTGVGGFPLREAARIMREEILSFAGEPAGPEEVRIVLIDDTALSVFGEVFPEAEIAP